MTLRGQFVMVELLVLATYEKTAASERSLRRWRGAAADGEFRLVEPVSDCLGVLWQIEQQASHPSDVVRLVGGLNESGSLPPNQQLGATTLLVVKGDPAATREVGDLLCADAGMCVGGAWNNVGRLYGGVDSRRLVLLCDPNRDTAGLLTGRAVGVIRLLETLRHKIEGQFAEYTREFRSPLLTAEQELSAHLARLSCLAGDSTQLGSDSAETTLAAGQDVTEAYCKAALVHGPVRKIEAMLAANLQNMRETVLRFLPETDGTPGAKLLRQRATRLEMLLGQVQADLGLVEPVLDAAWRVGQFHRGQLLARLSSTEAAENRQRDRESVARERQNFRLVMLGIWIGISQLWLAWIAMWPSESRPAGPTLLIWCLLPTAVAVVVYGAAFLLRNLSGPGCPRILGQATADRNRRD